MTKVKDGMNVTGSLKFFKNGELVREEKNLVVNTGLNVIANRLVGVSKNPISHMAIGTGTTAANSADIGLEIPKASRVVASSITAVAGVVTVVTTFAGSTHAGIITEAGLFNSLTAGEIISRVVFAPYVLGSSDALTITWTLTFANV
jgi:hypothetical protein